MFGINNPLPQLEYLMPAATGTADSALFTAAFASSKKRIRLREGTYIIDSQVTGAGSKHFIGSPMGTTIKMKNATNLDQMMLFTSASDVTFEGITFDSNQANQSSGQGRALSFIDSRNVKVNTCVFTNSLVCAVRLFRCARAEVARNRFQDHVRRALQIEGGRDLQIQGNVFKNYNSSNNASNSPAIQVFLASNSVTINVTTDVLTAASHGLAVNDRIAFTSWTVAPGGASLNTVYYVISVPDANTFTVSATLGGASLNFTGSPAGANYVSMAGTSTAMLGGFSAQNTEGVHSMAENCTVTANHFYPLASRQFAIEWIADIDGFYHRGWSITGNVADGNGIGGTGFSGAITHSTFASNSFRNGSLLDTGGTFNGWRQGIEIGGYSNTIVGNKFHNGSIYLYKPSSFSGTAARNEVIKDNQLYLESSTATSMSGIQFQDAADALIEGNTIELVVTVGGTATIQSCIYAGTANTTGVLTKVRIANNICSMRKSDGTVPGAGQGIRLLTSSSTHVQIVGNTLDNCLNGIFLPNTAVDEDLLVAGNECVGCSTPISGSPKGKGVSVIRNKVTSGSGPDGSIQLKTSGYTATITDDTIFCDTGTGFTVTLPAWPTQSQRLKIKKITTDANTLTITHNQNLLEGAIADLTTAATTLPVFVLENRQKTQTATVTIASPGVVTANAHGLVAGCAIVWTTTGALPTGITAGTIYYVIATGLTANAFQFSATVGGAAVNTSGSQSGTHTIISNAWWKMQ